MPNVLEVLDISMNYFLNRKSWEMQIFTFVLEKDLPGNHLYTKLPKHFSVAYLKIMFRYNRNVLFFCATLDKYNADTKIEGQNS